MGKKQVLIISGPTGVGENTILEEFKKKYSNFTRLVTATTRKLREGEKNEVDYYFMSNEQFEKEIEKGNIPEYQNSRNENVYYGTYLLDLKKKIKEGKIIVALTDVTGSRYFKENYNATTIFILPDSIDNLKKRHLGRNPNIGNQELKERLDYAKREVEEEADFYDFKVTNAQNKLNETIKKIEAILESEGYQLKKR
jgi:guanylate kinase